MSVSDPIADFLTCLRNAIRAKHRKVDVPASGLKTEIAKVLLRERYINNFKVIEDTRQGVLRVYLKYGVYVGKGKLPRVMGGLGSSIVSTSRGVMTDREARDAGLGGELICLIW